MRRHGRRAGCCSAACSSHGSSSPPTSSISASAPVALPALVPERVLLARACFARDGRLSAVWRAADRGVDPAAGCALLIVVWWAVAGRLVTIAVAAVVLLAAAWRSRVSTLLLWAGAAADSASPGRTACRRWTSVLPPSRWRGSRFRSARRGSSVARCRAPGGFFARPRSLHCGARRHGARSLPVSVSSPPRRDARSI